VKPVEFINRYTGEIEREEIYGEPFLRWAYERAAGWLALQAIVKRPLFSRWYGWRMNRPQSRKRIHPFIEDYQLDPSEFLLDPGDFEHFNAFFSRQLKPEARPIDPATDAVVFPADGRHFCLPEIGRETHFFAKGQRFNLAAFLQSEELAEQFAGGALLCSRLCPVDYHRFHFPLHGIARPSSLINGPLFAVSPIALRRNLSYLWQNKRALTRLENSPVGTVLIAEIGATCVGTIQQTFSPNAKVEKGQEKGTFLFGGSCTILLFQAGRIAFTDDLLNASRQGLELYARMGDHAASIIT